MYRVILISGVQYNDATLSYNTQRSLQVRSRAPSPSTSSPPACWYPSVCSEQLRVFKRLISQRDRERIYSCTYFTEVL